MFSSTTANNQLSITFFKGSKMPKNQIEPCIKRKMLNHLSHSDKKSLRIYCLLLGWLSVKILLRTKYLANNSKIRIGKDLKNLQANKYKQKWLKSKKDFIILRLLKNKQRLFGTLFPTKYKQKMMNF